MTKGQTPPAEFGHEIRRRREAMGLTLEQLSERSGLTPNYIGTIENGRRDPSLSTVLSLAKGLGVEPGELFGVVADLSPAAGEVARMYDGVSQEVQSAVSGLLRAIVALSKKRRT